LTGTFFTLLPVASTLDLRVILVQRRLYPGSTPYTEEEKRIAFSGTEDQRKELVHKNATLLALFVDNMIKDHGLGRVAVVGWSVGSGFLNQVINAFQSLDHEPQERLKKRVHALIYWDPPANIMGFDAPPNGGWVPLYDLTLSPEERAAAFEKWLSYHYPHPDLASHDPATLIYKLDAPVKTPSFTGISREDFLTMVDFSAYRNGDIIGTPPYRGILAAERQNALLSAQIRQGWENAKFCCIYGDQSPWNVQWGTWCLEKLIRDANNPQFSIHFKAMKGANHFVMSDNPTLPLQTIKELIE